MFNLDHLFCHVDDFCQQFEPLWQQKLLDYGGAKRIRPKSLCLSEIMTILIAFHLSWCAFGCVFRRRGVAPQNHYRDFKHFYLEHVK